VKFVLTGGNAAGTVSTTDTATIAADQPVFYVGLRHIPSTITSVTVGGTTVTAHGTGATTGLRYQVSQNKILFLQDGTPTRVSGGIAVAYSYATPGFAGAVTAPVLVRIQDNDAPTVLVRETGGSTDVVEVSYGPSSPVTQTQSQTIVNRLYSPNVLYFTFPSNLTATGTGTLTLAADADLDATVEYLDVYGVKSSGEDYLGRVFNTAGSVSAVSVYRATGTATISGLTSTQLTNYLVGGQRVFKVVPSTNVNNYGPNSLRLTLSYPAVPPAAEVADTYEIVLTDAPAVGKTVTVTVTPEITKTTRTGGIREDLEQVSISSSDSRATLNTTTGNLTVVFSPTNWDQPVVINVSAIDDAVVDGDDTQVFATGPHSLSGILGPLSIDGAAGKGSTVGIPAPVRLPGELNVKASTGDISAVNGVSVTVFTADLDAVLAQLGLTARAQLVNKTLEITAVADPNNTTHSAIGQFRLITAVGPDTLPATTGGRNTTTLTINEAYSLNLNGNVNETENNLSQYAITTESLNFFVNEKAAIDVIFFHGEDSPANSTGTLTSSRVYGFNMGPDITIGPKYLPGGVTFNALEVASVQLGAGTDTVNVLGATRRDDFQTWTFLNTGSEPTGVNGDDVTVALNATESVVRTGTVASTGVPSATSFPLVVLSSVVDGVIPANNAYNGLWLEITSGLSSGEKRQIQYNVENQLFLQSAFNNPITTGTTYRLFHAADGSFALDLQEGNDTVAASSSTLPLILLGGLGNDTLTGGSGDDIIFGDRGRVDFFGEADAAGNRPIITRVGYAPAPITGLAVAPFTDNSKLNGAGFPVPDSDDIGLKGLYVSINNGTGFLQDFAELDRNARCHQPLSNFDRSGGPNGWSQTGRRSDHLVGPDQ
jgi:hypothetical protein